MKVLTVNQSPLISWRNIQNVDRVEIRPQIISVPCPESYFKRENLYSEGKTSTILDTIR